jgi:hypothetical protein
MIFQIGKTRGTTAPTVDANSPAAKPTQSSPNAGLLQPYPNLAELPPEQANSWDFKPSAKADAARQVFLDKNGAIGDSEARHARGEAIKQAKDAALSAATPINNQQSPESSDDSTSGVGDIVEEAAKSSEAALKAEEKHDDEVAARRTQELKDLHQDMQLSTTGTTAPAA